ncbi:MAG: hypothetical protein ACYDEV_09460 [Acidiferrobacter sp.]
MTGAPRDIQVAIQNYFRKQVNGRQKLGRSCDLSLIGYRRLGYLALQTHTTSIYPAIANTPPKRPGPDPTMLMVTRKSGERILITLDPAADPALRAEELFAHGPIEITIAATGPTSARVAIAAPEPFLISRAPRDSQK